MKADPLLLQFITDLTSRLSVEAVAVFGSRGRGEAWPDSDYDIMVVSDEFAGQNPIQRWERVSPSWTALKAADIISVTSAELLAMDRLILWDALQDGNPLFDRGIWREAAARFRRKKEAGEIVPIEGGWRVAEPPA